MGRLNLREVRKGTKWGHTKDTMAAAMDLQFQVQLLRGKAMLGHTALSKTKTPWTTLQISTSKSFISNTRRSNKCNSKTICNTIARSHPQAQEEATTIEPFLWLIHPRWTRSLGQLAQVSPTDKHPKSWLTQEVSLKFWCNEFYRHSISECIHEVREDRNCEEEIYYHILLYL